MVGAMFTRPMTWTCDLNSILGSIVYLFDLSVHSDSSGLHVHVMMFQVHFLSAL
jgi:hypothetical protein